MSYFLELLQKFRIFLRIKYLKFLFILNSKYIKNLKNNTKLSSNLEINTNSYFQYRDWLQRESYKEDTFSDCYWSNGPHRCDEKHGYSSACAESPPPRRTVTDRTRICTRFLLTLRTGPQAGAPWSHAPILHELWWPQQQRWWRRWWWKWWRT